MDRWMSSSSLPGFDVHDPATGEVLATVRPHDRREIEDLIGAASVAQQQWRRQSIDERSAVLRACAQVLRDNQEELALLECRENGKPLNQAQGDVAACIGLFETFAAFILAERGAVRRTAYSLDVTERVPVGVVAAIIPFNWPPIHTAGKLAPALAAGNAVVLKPGEQCPLVATRIVELVADVLPEGLVAVIQGGPVQVRTMIEHPAVRAVGFTGSPGAGVAISKIAAESHTPTLMELGGKDCIIVCDDADVEAAASWAIDGGFFNQGESCTAASRLVVHENVYEHFLAKFLEQVAELRIGAGLEPGTHVGPMVDRRHQQRVFDHIRMGIEEGARLAYQAVLDLNTEPFRSGYFVPPTVFEATANMHVAREEIFGPVVSVLSFADDDEAISIANNTDYGLIAGVFSGDTTRALRIVEGLDVGMTLVNNYHRGIVGSPFGGTKASGSGREHCAATLDEYSYSKLIRIPSGNTEIPRWGIV
ncbi:aldehyde dehydrogenase [Mycobacteroides abscessus subsp. abscessus]|nr:aldehyde dehydrogenase [Mycobacteroides abscessus subsp. abscessus]SHT55538.1 aldehyde dehydrogenase [Mycobacteroides abscessus subsp. abscessus]SHT57849.1 aldehyde dehydrogenase [Mycobacteroides abscessus subsp. abscessus]SHX51509.1 aldehyde dehydrogenase [Mycobacteroides abscessus subsp. abscessus]SIB59298.1 aldehyde dehydrogenase [Mycobacteroides abscessus subsp. abscessus]